MEEHKQSVQPDISFLDQPVPYGGLSVSEMKSRSDRVREVLDSFEIRYSDVRFVLGRGITLYRVFIKEQPYVEKLMSLSEQISAAIGTGSIRIRKFDDSVGLEVPDCEHPKIFFRELLLGYEVREADYSAFPLFIGMNQVQKTKIISMSSPNVLLSGGDREERANVLHEILLSLLFFQKKDEFRLSVSGTGKTGMERYSGLPKTMFFGDDNTAALSPEELLSRLKIIHNEIEERRSNDILLQREPCIFTIVDFDSSGTDESIRKEILQEISTISSQGPFKKVYTVASVQVADVRILNEETSLFNERIAFRTSDGPDSENIIRDAGARYLSGQGDMLVFPSMNRVRAAQVSEPEIKRVIEHFR